MVSFFTIHKLSEFISNNNNNFLNCNFLSSMFNQLENREIKNKAEDEKRNF